MRTLIRNYKGIDTMNRGVTAVTALLVLTGLTGAPALASPGDDAGEGAPQDRRPEQQPVMLVLDASGSMLQEDAGAVGTRMDAARAALKDLITATPDGAELGLMVYGSEVGNSDAEQAAGCQDIRTLVEVGPVDKDALTRAVEGVQASGWTPIGRSLQLATEELPTEGPRSIVLVSDGIDSCGDPDPCEVARDLAADGVDLAVHTVGFRVDGAARAQLQCVAEATGGTYADADDAGELTEQMSVQVQRAMRSYVPAGQPVRGGADQASALTVDEGDHVIELTSQDGSHPDRSVQHFAVPMHEGERLHVAVSAVRPQASGSPYDFMTIGLEQLGADGKECRRTSDGNRASNLMGGPPTAVLITEPAAAGENCFPEGYAVVAVTRSGDQAANGPVPVELSITREAPVDVDSLRPVSPVQTDPPELSEADRSSATPVVPGLNYSTATPLVPGTYTADLTSGEFHVYQVRVEPGQRLGATVMPLVDTGRGSSLQLNFAAPDRTALQPDSSGSGFRKGHFTVGMESGEVIADLTRATVNPAEPEQPYQAGDYFVMVSGEGFDPGTVPYLLALEVTGEAVDAPTPLAELVPLTEDGRQQASSTDAAMTTSGAGTDGAPATTDGAGDGTASTTDPAGAGDGSDGATTAGGDSPADSSGEGGISPLVWVLGGLGILVAAAGAWLVSRERTS